MAKVPLIIEVEYDTETPWGDDQLGEDEPDDLASYVESLRWFSNATVWTLNGFVAVVENEWSRTGYGSSALRALCRVLQKARLA